MACQPSLEVPAPEVFSLVSTTIEPILLILSLLMLVAGAYQHTCALPTVCAGKGLQGTVASRLEGFLELVGSCCGFH